ncbi:efflux RND transporter periplasmic adaptor subunit [Corticibacter populi]|uniref:Efflux RND transporter periplasmic adaptor subunit n=1 Tax=Corticibacter populi TaxID=1550736 RepID=A0A3M6QU09_9BURK|nr:efflux RND transporter periplasmic adaptor subunit [Corticibacter populi]RMX06361.1 efflux RND transporter periplasmic adaptor subunit [Corticibacter populi]RZS32096.1 multidrug efflux system membrane fusion protein [Corticibacter populi]
MPSPAPVSPPSAHGSSKRLLIWLVVIIAALALLWFFLLRNTKPPVPAGPSPFAQPVAVLVAPVEQGDFTVQVQSIGTVTPFNAVTVRSRVAGTLLKVHVQEGQTVKQGQLLAEIDPEPYRVALAQAKGQQQQNLAQLRNAQNELARYQRLFQQDSIARLELERQQAQVQQLQGTGQADQAQVDEAQLQLSYTRITAPISGRVGMRRVDAGNLIGANDADGLFTIVQTQPVSVLFTVPEPQVTSVRQAHAGATPPLVQAWDRDNRRLLASGVLDTLDNQIDIATGTLRLKGRFENADDTLFPNQFVNTRLALQTLQDVLTIPADAVQFGSIGTYVYVIEDGKASRRVLELGPSSDGRTVVLAGLEAGQSVVLEGIDRLREGRAVTMVNADQAPAGEATPAAEPPRRGQPGGGAATGG